MKKTNGLIAENRRARHEYYIEKTISAGIKLEGWEVKSLRAGSGQLTDSYVIFKGGEPFLMGCLMQPLSSTSTHILADPMRTRKLLLNRAEIEKLRDGVERKGYTCVALNLSWDRHLVKCTIGLAKGKQSHDKRDAIKGRDAARDMSIAVKAARRA